MKSTKERFENYLQKKHSAIQLFHIIWLPIFSLIISESIWRGGFTQFFSWCISFPTSLILSVVLYFSIYNIWAFLGSKVSIIVRWILFILITVVSFVCRIKIENRNEVLEIQDVFLIKEGLDIGKNYISSELSIIVIGLLLLFILLLFTVYMLPKGYNAYQSLSLSFICIILSIIIITGFPYNIIKELNVSASKISAMENANEIGLFNSFYIQDHQVSLQSKYSQERIEKIVEFNKRSKIKSVSEVTKPNVIYILGESVFNPETLGKDLFKQEVMPNLDEIMKNTASGSVLTHQYGGGTHNPEFEVLSGLNPRYLSDGPNVYDACLKEDIKMESALPKVFSKGGYITAAYHTYKKNFYGRDKVFPDCMGFDSFKGQEDLIKTQAITNSQFPRDSILYNKSIKQINKTKKSDFIYLATMNTHGPYKVSKNSKFIKEDINLSEKERGELEYYSQRANEADKDLGEFLNKLRKIDEPTIVLYFGDHYPALGEKGSIYKNLDYTKDLISKVDNEDYIKTHNTPFFIWSNYKNDIKNKKYTNMSLAFISSMVVKESRVKSNPIFDWLINNQEKERFPSPYIEGTGWYNKKFDDYQLLLHDITDGESYQLKEK